MNRLHCIIPPFMLEKMAGSPDPEVRKIALESLAASAAARAVRGTLSLLAPMAAIPSPARGKHRLVYDMKNKEPGGLPGLLVRSEGQAKSRDSAVNEAYDGAGHTYDFYLKFFKRNSLDGKGMSLISSVHLSRRYNNAFWDGEQMAYGDGDGLVFTRFTRSLDVIGHELTHGVVAHSCNLEYQGEPGALNEHFADVMGSLVKQWRRKQDVKKADWLIGDEILIKTSTRRALRSLAAPGTAYRNDPDIGSDPQPAHMKEKYTGPQDYGGVHINSGIANRAFYLAAMRMGGYAWQKAGLIWYEALLGLSSRSRFEDAASITLEKAQKRFGKGSREHKAAQSAWKEVGL